MNRPGRLPGPLKGRTAEANALAQFLRELTAQDTVSRLEEQYRLSRSVWSEYRSGLKTIPLPRLNQIIEDRFPRDARTRGAKLQEARRLHAAAMAATPAPPAAAPAPGPAPTSAPAPGGPAPGPDQAPTPAAAIVRDDTAELSADNPPTSDDAAPKRPSETAPDQPPAAPADPSLRGYAAEGAPPTGLVPRAARLRRWRTPAQWAALAALVAVLVIANQIQRSKDQPDTASSLGDPGQGRQSAAPAEPGSLSSGPTAAEESRPTPPTSSAQASSAPTRSPGGGASTVAATSSRLYRITADAQVEEYTGKAGAWTVIRKHATNRIFTSPTTLYATDSGTGNIEEFDGSKKTWTVIGGPGSFFAATASHLYGVGTLGTMEYSGTPGVWHLVRGATDRIFTSSTTLYTTDTTGGKLQEYDRSKKIWTVIGDPVSSFVATKDRLYSVSADLSNIYEYSSTPGSWSPIGSP
ncbi:hypothetical protein ACH4U5_39555 [Streptomyces sp. NPDC020858]|uniref:hypothetical protein n=1 Tax=Streptomyces sp. NPDC020858 TaxID=3365097 RepID=UPI0037A03B82